MKMVSLKQPSNQIQEISCVPNTPNTMANCIGALVRRRYGDKSVILMVEMYFYNRNKKTARQQLVNGHKNGIAMLKNEAQGPYFRQCKLSTMLTQLDHMIIPQSVIKNHSRVPISGEQKIGIVCRVRNHLKAILSDQSILEFVLK